MATAAESVVTAVEGTMIVAGGTVIAVEAVQVSETHNCTKSRHWRAHATTDGVTSFTDSKCSVNDDINTDDRVLNDGVWAKAMRKQCGHNTTSQSVLSPLELDRQRLSTNVMFFGVPVCQRRCGGTH